MHPDWTALSSSARATQLAVLAGSRVETFRYELHRQVADSGGVLRWQVVDANLQGVASCVISFDRLARIKRTATLRVRDDGNVRFTTDAVRVFWTFRAASVGSTAYTYCMGTFYLNTPDLPLTRQGRVREVVGYDATILADHAKRTDWLTVPALDQVVQTAINILAADFPLAGILIPLSTDLFGEPKIFEAGMPDLDVVNRVLAYVNYTSLRADVNGSFVSNPYVAPTARASELTYSDALPLIVGDASVLELDVFDAPNRFVRTVSRPGQGAPYPLLSQYDIPQGPLSAAARNQVIVSYDSIDARDQATLDAITRADAEEVMIGRHSLRFRTPLMPHDWADCLTIGPYARLPSSEPQGGRWIERSWVFPCTPGGPMEHVVQAVDATT